jgi:hypothetical protein
MGACFLGVLRRALVYETANGTGVEGGQKRPLIDRLTAARSPGSEAPVAFCRTVRTWLRAVAGRATCLVWQWVVGA